MSKNVVFQKVKNLHPEKNAFDLSYDHKFTTDMGILYPVQVDEVVAGDVWKMSNEVVTRMMPMIAPVIHDISINTHTFFIPYRLLQDDWDKFISGGSKGTYVGKVPKYPLTMDDNQVGTIWEALGHPVGDPVDGYIKKKLDELAVDPAYDRNVPDDYARRAYNFVYDEYYRDQNLQLPINDDGTGESSQPPKVWASDLNSKMLKRRNWKKDYKRAALPFRQRGTAPSLPIAGTTSAVFEGPVAGLNDVLATRVQFDRALGGGTFGAQAANVETWASAFKNWHNTNSVDLSVASTFDIADLRVAFQLQKFLERNARTGVRYTEFLKAHFGVSPSDERLNRPEYIGGTKQWLIVSEVLQTSETSSESPQGTMAGHGITATSGFIGTYRVLEPGIIMTLLSIMPEPVYEDGINRQWLRNEKEDFYFREFANLSEQAIYNCEIMPTGIESVDMDIWGYIPRYDEMRVKQSKVTGLMRVKLPPGEQSLAFWHLGQSFVEGSVPPLNSSFIECNPDKRIFAVPSEPGFLVNYASRIVGIRPMPLIAEPGLIDHF